eukprot:3426698-Amphidinium_carterae.1
MLALVHRNHATCRTLCACDRTHNQAAWTQPFGYKPCVLSLDSPLGVFAGSPWLQTAADSEEESMWDWWPDLEAGLQ